MVIISDQFSPSSPNISITGDATGQIDLGPDHTPIEVIGNEAIRGSFGDSCIYQAMAAARSPGVSRFILNPDAHWGYSVSQRRRTTRLCGVWYARGG